MNKTKIEWADYTWNPVTGCLHGCGYCYARKIANRFAGGGYGKEKDMFISKYKGDAFKPPYVLNDPQLVKTKDDWYRVAPYPFGFAPTFHKYRLNEPQQVKKSSKIFVVSMGDLFGEWIPDEWIDEVFQACFNADRHKYLFLTKNPARYKKAIAYTEGEERGFEPEHWNSMWFGTTVTDDDSFIYKGADLYQNTGFDMPKGKRANRFLSIEPLLGKIDESRLSCCIRYVDWVIIGQQTNPDRPPKDEWVQAIIDQCRTAGVPVFMKSPLFEKFPIQEWPEGLK